MSGFNPQALVDKLTRLNNSQQSIETLSNWCTFYRKVGGIISLVPPFFCKILQESTVCSWPNAQDMICPKGDQLLLLIRRTTQHWLHR